jgi:hypothetical protein
MLDVWRAGTTGMSFGVRNPVVIRREIDALSERRANVWRRGAGGDSVQAQVNALTRRIEELWLELRTIRATLRAGSREQILARARRASRAEQELRRRVPIV